MEPAEAVRSPQTEPDPESDGRAAVRAAAAGKVSEKSENAAVEWFLGEDDPLTQTIEINVGTEDKQNWIPWEIKPVDLDVLRRIRKSNTGRRGNEEIDELRANIQITVAGTISPPLGEMAKQRGVAAPEEVVRLRFAQKPGLVTQISQKVLALSGYDDADLRDPGAVGN